MVRKVVSVQNSQLLTLIFLIFITTADAPGVISILFSFITISVTMVKFFRFSRFADEGIFVPFWVSEKDLWVKNKKFLK